MEDREIIRLYFSRSGEAIEQTEQKYGRLYRHIAANTRASPEDREECVSGAWNAIPPQNPGRFSFAA